MRTDHRRPLVAYVLTALACAFVVAPSLDFGDLGIGPKPTFSAFSDTMMTPSEAAEEVIDPTDFPPDPDSELVEPVAEDEDTFVPDLDAIEDFLGGPVFGAEDADPGTTADEVGSPAPDPDGGGTQLVAGPPQTVLVDSGGSAGGDSGSSGDGDAAAGGPSDPDFSDGSGGFDGVPPSDGGPGTSPGVGGPVTSPGDGGGPTGASNGADGPEAPGPENGNGNGNKNPAPHSFDHVSPGAHPYGHVGSPPPGNGSNGNGSNGNGSNGNGSNGHGSKDQGDQSHGPQDKGRPGKGPQGKANGHHNNSGKSNGKGHQSKGSKQGHHGKR
ncbi:MAG: hypothetical protein WKF50_12255 [Nocardioides sp.]